MRAITKKLIAYACASVVFSATGVVDATSAPQIGGTGDHFSSTTALKPASSKSSLRATGNFPSNLTVVCTGENRSPVVCIVTRINPTKFRISYSDIGEEFAKHKSTSCVLALGQAIPKWANLNRHDLRAGTWKTIYVDADISVPRLLPLSMTLQPPIANDAESFCLKMFGVPGGMTGLKDDYVDILVQNRLAEYGPGLLLTLKKNQPKVYARAKDLLNQDRTYAQFAPLVRYFLTHDLAPDEERAFACMIDRLGPQIFAEFPRLTFDEKTKICWTYGRMINSTLHGIAIGSQNDFLKLILAAGFVNQTESGAYQINETIFNRLSLYDDIFLSTCLTQLLSGHDFSIAKLFLVGAILERHIEFHYRLLCPTRYFTKIDPDLWDTMTPREKVVSFCNLMYVGALLSRNVDFNRLIIQTDIQDSLGIEGTGDLVRRNGDMLGTTKINFETLNTILPQLAPEIRKLFLGCLTVLVAEELPYVFLLDDWTIEAHREQLKKLMRLSGYSKHWKTPFQAQTKPQSTYLDASATLKAIIAALKNMGCPYEAEQLACIANNLTSFSPALYDLGVLIRR